MGDIKKIVALVVILSLLGGGFVFWANQTNANVLYFLKEFVIKPLIRTLANALENKIVNSIIAKITGVKQGQPSFITNWRNQILESEARGNDVFRSVLADAKLCPYFKTNLQQAFGADKYAGTISGATVKNSAGQVTYQNKTSVPGQPSFQNLANCTLAPDLNVDLFRKDFSNGGWNAWNQLIQPQNNFFGAYSLALGEQVKQTQIESQSSRDKSIAGQGFTGSKLGTGTGNNASNTCLQTCQTQQQQCNSRAASGLLGGSIAECSNIAASCKANCPPSSLTGPDGCTGSLSGSNRCLFLGKEVTPPKLIADLNSTALGSKISRAGFGTELTDVIQGLIGAVMTGLLQGITNLMGQQGYNAAPIANSLFDESQSNTAVPSNLQNAGSGANCRQLCSSNYNSCNASNNPTLSSNASGENLSVCSDELSSCNANCPP